MSTVEQMLQGLREYHRMGQITLHTPDKLTAAEKVLMETYSTLNPDTQRKVANFAFAKHGYTEQELEKLIELCREHEFAMGISLVKRLISIPKTDRWAAQKKIVEGGWSRRDLDRWIKAQYGSRTKAGRRPKGFFSPEDLQAGITSTCLSWLRQEENIDRTNAEAFSMLPKPIKQLYKRASTIIGKLYKELESQ